MSNEDVGKRTNGSGGSGGGNGGSGRPPTRNGARETERLVGQFREHFTTFEDASYFTRWARGVRGAAARRELADRLEFSAGLIPELIALLRAEAIDMEAGAESVVDEPSTNGKKP